MDTEWWKMDGVASARVNRQQGVTATKALSCDIRWRNQGLLYSLSTSTPSVKMYMWILAGTLVLMSEVAWDIEMRGREGRVP